MSEVRAHYLSLSMVPTFVGLEDKEGEEEEGFSFHVVVVYQDRFWSSSQCRHNFSN